MWKILGQLTREPEEAWIQICCFGVGKGRIEDANIQKFVEGCEPHKLRKRTKELTNNSKYMRYKQIDNEPEHA